MYNNMVIYGIFMFIMFIYFLMMSIYLNLSDNSVFIEWLIFNSNGMNIEFVMYMDWITCLFLSILLIITSMILFYSFIYMGGDKFLDQFVLLIILFVISMILMIISPNLVSILFGWDGLGVISYCLVIFYQNYSAYNSGMVTVLMNRVGDVGLLMSISLMLMSGSWNLFMMSSDQLIVMMMVLGAITKSAQIPFSSWLPMAMAAPTPVSALVHSSTLVTAGVYLMIRFNEILMQSKVNLILLLLSILTMFMAGIIALFEYDLKKIIALSTLSQLGLMMMILSVGMKMMAFFHLLTHAIFKSLLFLCAGIIIHSLMNSQDIRLMGGLNKVMPFTMMSFYISLMALSGMVFLSGFYSKDTIMEVLYFSEMNMVLIFLGVVSLMLTIMYSFRLFYYLFFNSMKSSSLLMIEENSMMNFSMVMLILFSVISGSMINWLFFFDLKIIFLMFYLKVLTLFVCLFGVIISLNLVWMYFLKVYYVSYFMGSMWFLNNMYKYSYFKLLECGGKMVEFDKMWLEYSKKMIYMNLLKYFINYLFYYPFKIYMFMCMFFMGVVMVLFKGALIN